MADSQQTSILKMISQIYRKTQMYLNEQMKQAGLTSGQAPFIMITCENGCMGQNKFCELLDMNKSTVAKMLQKLEEQGYVVRRESETDARSVDVYPTERAREVYPFLVQVGEDWSVQITEGMTEIERAIFFQMLERVSRNITKRRM